MVSDTVSPTVRRAIVVFSHWNLFAYLIECTYYKNLKCLQQSRDYCSLLPAPAHLFLCSNQSRGSGTKSDNVLYNTGRFPSVQEGLGFGEGAVDIVPFGCAAQKADWQMARGKKRRVETRRHRLLDREVRNLDKGGEKNDTSSYMHNF